MLSIREKGSSGVPDFGFWVVGGLGIAELLGFKVRRPSFDTAILPVTPSFLVKEFCRWKGEGGIKLGIDTKLCFWDWANWETRDGEMENVFGFGASGSWGFGASGSWGFGASGSLGLGASGSLGLEASVSLGLGTSGGLGMPGSLGLGTSGRLGAAAVGSV